METQLREAKTKSADIPASLREQIVIEHTPLIRYIVSRIAVRLPSHIDLEHKALFDGLLAPALLI